MNFQQQWWLFNDEDKNSHDPSLLETPGGRNYTLWSCKLDVSVQIERCHVICLKGHHFFPVRESRPVSHTAVWTGVTSLKWVLARDSCTQSQGNMRNYNHCKSKIYDKKVTINSHQCDEMRRRWMFTWQRVGRLCWRFFSWFGQKANWIMTLKL